MNVVCNNKYLIISVYTRLLTYQYPIVIVIYDPSARRHFSLMSALFEAQAMTERLRASRIVQNFLKRTLAFLNYYPIVSNLVNRWRLPKCQSN
jgi:hypothetical protein